MSVTELLSCKSYVVLDFSKAFDTALHSIRLHKLASMNIPDNVYNWLVDFFSGHSHSTRFRSCTSRQLDISASIMQGSAIGLASCVVNAAALTTVTAGNLMFKYADDTYIVIPASNANSGSAELDNVDCWAQNNNLRLNRAKSADIIFTNCRHKDAEGLPPQIPDIRRVTSIKIQDAYRHCDESFVCKNAQSLCCPETAPLPRHERQLAEARLQGHRPLQAVICFTGMQSKGCTNYGQF